MQLVSWSTSALLMSQSICASTMNGASSQENLNYLTGFAVVGNELASEALPNTLPARGNNPKFCPRGLYSEQISGTAFTVPRSVQRRSWLYRISPSVSNRPKKILENPPEHLVSDFRHCIAEPNQQRWTGLEFDSLTKSTNFVFGLHTLCGTGSASTKSGFAIHLYIANANMNSTCFMNSDGDFLIVPQEGDLEIMTEFGQLVITPGEICVVPRGIVYSVQLPSGKARGYILEVFEGHFTLPELGPIGANSLANPRDFQHPVARFEDQIEDYLEITKFQGMLFESHRTHSPFDVVAWHGNYLPFKYDLAKFCPVNSVLFDHPDPSISTVLTVQSPLPGVAVADFVAFPARWMVAENTFRPPYFHRNCMNEFIGLIKGGYDAKTGFKPGSASLHLCMVPHGPDKDSFEANQKPEEDKPVKTSEGSLAFMFETNFVPLLTPFALQTKLREDNYLQCWHGFTRNFVSDKNN